jgi:hypothetical protein
MITLILGAILIAVYVTGCASMTGWLSTQRKFALAEKVVMSFIWPLSGMALLVQAWMDLCADYWEKVGNRQNSKTEKGKGK